MKKETTISGRFQTGPAFQSDAGMRAAVDRSRQTDGLIVLEADMGNIERRVVASMNVDEVKLQIANAAGLPRQLVQIGWSMFPKAPPYVIVLDSGVNFQTGKRQSERVVHVGREWLLTQRPQLWAVLVTWRLQGGADPFA